MLKASTHTNKTSTNTMSFTTYVTTWGTATQAQDPMQVIQDMINQGALSKGSRVMLAFASFNFASTDYIPGFNNLSLQTTQQIVQLVHSVNACISLSIGGATYPFYGSDLYSRPGDLAANINSIVNKCGFDGVDFDIEDSSSNVPADFATQAASVINTLRSLNSGLYISLTTPAQAWGVGMYQQSLLNLTIGNINAWQPMEYDLWIDPTLSYMGQIQWDVLYYINSWKVDPQKIVLGLMPGLDDLQHDLSLQDALQLTTFTTSSKLQGVMTWDANIDSFGIDGNAPYAYTMGIQAMLNKKRKFYYTV